MNKFLWIATGATIGVAAYVLLGKASSPAFGRPYDNDGLDDASDELRSGARRFSRKASTWGTGQRVSGTAGQVGGRLEEGAANLTGNANLADKGVTDQVVGSVKDVAGRAAHAVSDTVDDLTR